MPRRIVVLNNEVWSISESKFKIIFGIDTRSELARNNAATIIREYGKLLRVADWMIRTD